MRNPSCRTDPWDFLKFISLNGKGDWFISLGGEVRETFEYFNNALWGQGPQGPAYLLQRYMGSIDLHLGRRLRAYGQLKSGLEEGRKGGPRPVDEDKLDLNQAFLDVVLFNQGKRSVTLRAGRQELAYGSARFVSVREGPNVHQTFDAVRAIFQAGLFRVDTFLSKPVETRPGIFDDLPVPGRTFWGLYATTPWRQSRTAHVDLYYLGLEHSKAGFQQGVAREQRHSIGTRVWGEKAAWSYDWEPVLQWGKFDDGHILAWAFESETGYTMNKMPAFPRLALRADIDSGDRNPADPNLQSFNPLFPRGLYHQLVNLNGHVNFVSVDPLLTLHFARSLFLTQDWDFFWRESLQDGIYGVGGNFLRPGNSGQARYVGSQPTSLLDWRIQRHIGVVLIYTHFFPGGFLRQTGPARPVNYVSGWVDYKF